MQIWNFFGAAIKYYGAKATRTFPFIVVGSLAGLQFWDSRNLIKQDVFIGGGEPIPGYATLIIDSSMGVS